MQAYGAKNYAAVGIWAQRGFLICTLACIPIVGLWLCAEPILLWVGQTAQVSHMTAVYIRWAVIFSSDACKLGLLGCKSYL